MERRHGVIPLCTVERMRFLPTEIDQEREICGHPALGAQHQRVVVGQPVGAREGELGELGSRTPTVLVGPVRAWAVDGGIELGRVEESPTVRTLVR